MFFNVFDLVLLGRLRLNRVAIVPFVIILALHWNIFEALWILGSLILDDPLPLFLCPLSSVLSQCNSLNGLWGETQKSNVKVKLINVFQQQTVLVGIVLFSGCP